MKALVIGLLVSAYFLRSGFRWLLPSRLHRAIACAIFAISPGSRAVFGELLWGYLAAFAGILLLLEEGPAWRRAVGGVLLGLGARASTYADPLTNFVGRAMFAPVLGPALAERLLTTWLGFLLAGIVLALGLLLFVKFPAERKPFLCLFALALLLAPTAGPYNGNLAMNEPRSFLAGFAALLFWVPLFFRGLKETAVVIYFAAVSVIGIYVLVLHHALLWYRS